MEQEQIASMSLDPINAFVQREGLAILSLPVNLLSFLRIEKECLAVQSVKHVQEDLSVTEESVRRRTLVLTTHSVLQTMLASS